VNLDFFMELSGCKTMSESSTSVASTDQGSLRRQLGGRIAEARRAQSLTQQQLGELLGISQQMVAFYEIDCWRVPISLLPELARTLDVAMEEPIGEEAKPAKHGLSPKLQPQLERITRPPKAQQRFVTQILDTVIQQMAR